MTGIVFSKDRAMQLHAFLRSYEHFVVPKMDLVVLYTATSERHLRAYGEVFNSFPNIRAKLQLGFRADLLELLSTIEDLVVFFVDDQVFVRPWAPAPVPGLSLRMGTHLRWCYPTNSEQRLPPMHIENGIVHWRWSDGQGDWGYPLSVDGHLFSASWMRALAEQVAFSSPNTFESALQRFRPMFANRYGACFIQSRIVNVPWNRVQTDCENRCDGSVSADEMLDAWEQGSQIDVERLYGVLNESCHQEFSLALESRRAGVRA